jgi:hypothetical protein
MPGWAVVDGDETVKVAVAVTVKGVESLMSQVFVMSPDKEPLMSADEKSILSDPLTVAELQVQLKATVKLVPVAAEALFVTVGCVQGDEAPAAVLAGS